MIYKRISLDPEDPRVFIDTYLSADRRTRARDAMIVIPGGAYANVCSDREGEFIALAYAAHGIHSFVLNYSTGSDVVYPRQLLDLSLAFKYIKEHADELHIDPERIFVVGFSAGGHLAGTLALHHKSAEKIMRLPENYLKPKGVILSYPVVTALAPTNIWTYEFLTGKHFDEISDEEKALHSLECHVTKEAPPAFIWHTSEDTGVPCHGSLMLGMAYRDAGVPFELHIFPRGEHGASLGTEYTSAGNPDFIMPDAEGWLDLSLSWISKQ